MNDQTVSRENLLFRYSTALERGDFGTITAILQLAENDPMLAKMILAADEEYYQELAPQHHLPEQPQPFAKLGFQQATPGKNHRSPASTMLARRQSQRSPFGFAAALIIIVLFILIFYNVVQRQFAKPSVTPLLTPIPTTLPPMLTPAPRPGKIAVMATSRDDRQTVLYIMLSPESQPATLATFSGTIAEAAGQVAWSPDGTQIAFTSCENGQCDLYVIQVDGTSQRQLANQVADFSWSADGRQLVFSNLNGQLYTIKNTGGQSVQLNIPINNSQNSYPAWSPDGKQIAFLSNYNNGEIYVMNTDATALRSVAQDVHDAVPIWSPDSQQLVFIIAGDTGDKVVVVDVNNARQHVVVDAAKNGPNALGRIAKWSPDGKMLAFFAYHQDMQLDLYVVDNQSLKVRRLIQPDNSSGAFAWSPDGSRLIFDGRCNQTQGLYVINVDGSSQQCLTSFDKVSAMNVDWTP